MRPRLTHTAVPAPGHPGIVDLVLMVASPVEGQVGEEGHRRPPGHPLFEGGLAGRDAAAQLVHPGPNLLHAGGVIEAPTADWGGRHGCLSAAN